MATVITNLISAIPWIGQDVVEFIKSLDLNYFILFLASWFNIYKNGIYNVASLPIIGVTNTRRRAEPKLKRLSKAEYLDIPKSFLAFLVGFIDGDGYIGIRKSYKDSISIHLTLSVHLDDISILNYIQSVLKLGKIYYYPVRKSPTARLIISRLELQEVLFPLFIQSGFFFLTNNRRGQYFRAMHIFKNDITKYTELPTVAMVTPELTSTALEYSNIPFFKDWIVGFTCAEGSFFIKENNDGCFQFKQKLHPILFEALKLVFKTNHKITVNKEHSQFGVSSKSDIQTVINFFSFSGHHSLVGLKSIQYSAWLAKLRCSKRYKNLKYPDLI